ncbi:MAG: TIGR00730 family Rossman fold protein [Proteobacteria bacterium]|nr:TIGR00730 family Rossman fold protein [Pseudomonadota bacterium]
MKTKLSDQTQQDSLGPEWDKLEESLHQMVGEQTPLRRKIISDIFKATIRLAKENPGSLNLKISATALKELRFSFKMFRPHRQSPKITMFGSARIAPSDPLYSLAKDFARKAVQRKYMVITGGGPGIMAAGNEGATAKGGFGLNIKLPFEQSANSFIDPERGLINYKYFFTRKLFLVKEAWAFAFFPGGFGTFDEAFEALTLLQTGKTNLVPVVFLETPNYGYWSEVIAFLNKVMLKKGLISESDRYLYKVCHSPEEALDHFDAFYKNYHSTRYVGDLVSIRIKKPVSEKTIERINHEFSDFLNAGKLQSSGPLPEEDNEPEIKDLPRLVFKWTKKDFGTLRHLIDFINENTV